MKKRRLIGLYTKYFAYGKRTYKENCKLIKKMVIANQEQHEDKDKEIYELLLQFEKYQAFFGTEFTQAILDDLYLHWFKMQKGERV